MFPFLNATTNIEYPLSGDVTQDISSAFIARMKGVPELEKEVVTRVASYGAQLGTITDAVLSIAKAVGASGEEIDKLSQMAKDVDSAKAESKVELRVRAETALRRLKDVDPKEYQKLIADAAEIKR